MSTEKPKNIGRTQWDFWAMLLENRRVLYWTNAIAWLAIVSAFIAWFRGDVTIQGKGLPTARSVGPPWVWSDPILYKSLDLSKCKAAVLQTVSGARPTYVG